MSEKQKESILVDVWNDFYPSRFEHLKKVLEQGNVVRIYVNCIGHTRSYWTERDYADRLRKHYGDRLVITGEPGHYGTTYRLQEAMECTE